MGIERVDLFFLHTNICENDYVFAVRPDRQNAFAACDHRGSGAGRAGAHDADRRIGFAGRLIFCASGI